MSQVRYCAWEFPALNTAAIAYKKLLKVRNCSVSITLCEYGDRAMMIVICDDRFSQRKIQRQKVENGLRITDFPSDLLARFAGRRLKLAAPLGYVLRIQYQE